MPYIPDRYNKSKYHVICDNCGLVDGPVDKIGMLPIGWIQNPELKHIRCTHCAIGQKREERDLL